MAAPSPLAPFYEEREKPSPLGWEGEGFGATLADILSAYFGTMPCGVTRCSGSFSCGFG